MLTLVPGAMVAVAETLVIAGGSTVNGMDAAPAGLATVTGPELAP